MRRHPVVVLLCLGLLAACAFPAPQAAPSAQVPTAQAASSVPLPTRQQGRCGDGLCSGPETASSCPADCTVAAQGTVPPAATPGSTPATDADVLPVYFFYVIHTHVNGDLLPYTSPARTNIDPNAADNMLAAIEGIAAVLDQHGVPGTWEVLASGASGLCAYQGQDHIFAQLLASGHEVAVHGHSSQGMRESYLALQTACGITPRTASGFMIDVFDAGPAGAQQAMVEGVETVLDLGMRVGTENLSPSDPRNPFGDLCPDEIGPGNTMWAETGNLMFPWRPDTAGGNICADNPAGEMVFLDHVPISWTIRSGSRPVDILADQDFDRLRTYLGAALDYMARERPSRVAVWGFVTHLLEYAPGGDAASPPDPTALAALDRFLTWVDAQVSQGRVIYVTAGEAAAIAYP